MKKQLIATLVGGIILFIWQFLSWTLLNVHQNEYKYTPNQDKILEALSANLTEPGVYFLPQAPPGSTHAEEEAYMKTVMDKPWASVSYHQRFNYNMAMNMIRGFLVDLVAIFLLVWLLMQFASLGFRNVLLASLAVGGVAYLTIPYLNSVWFEANTIGYVADLVAQWGLVGVWLGWWMPRKGRMETAA